MTVVVHLVRHGAHDLLGRVLCGADHPVRLNAAGAAQARAIAATLGPAGLEAVFASPAPRTMETAEPLAAAAGLRVTTEPRLSEIDFGLWRDCTFAELDGDPEWQRWNRDRAEARPPSGESMGEVQARIGAWLADCGACPDGAAVAGVSHADVIKAAVARVLGVSIACHDRFEIAPASITTIEIKDDAPRLVRMGEVPRG